MSNPAIIHHPGQANIIEIEPPEGSEMPHIRVIVDQRICTIRTANGQLLWSGSYADLLKKLQEPGRPPRMTLSRHEASEA